MSDKVILTCALTGAQQGKEANPNIPGECILWSVKNVLFLVESLPPHARWMVTAIGGKVHFLSVALSVALGGHVRVGMEDNVYIERGVLAKSNAQIVEKAVGILRALGKEPASPEEARAALGLRRENSGTRSGLR